MGTGSQTIHAHVGAGPACAGRAELAVAADGAILSLNPLAETLFGYSAAELAGQALNTLLLELPRVEPSRQHAGAPAAAVETGALLFGRHRNGRMFPLLGDIHASGSHTVIALQRTHSAEDESAAPPPPDLATSHRLLMVLNGLLQTAWTNVTPEQQLARALDAILALPELASGGRGAIYLLDAEDQLSLPVSQHFPPCAPTGRRQVLEIGECLCGHAATSQQNAGLRRVWRHTVPGGAGGSEPCFVPLVQGDRLLGILTLAFRHGRRRLEPGLLWLIAETLTTLVARLHTESENMRLLEANRRLSRRLIGILEEERRKIARELHDDVGQSLTAIKADAALILNRSDPESSPIGRSASAIAATADHLYAVTHNLLRQLRPGALDDLGLVSALRSHLNDWRTRRPGMACEFRLDGELDDLGEDLNIALYRVVQEALNNVMRHAAATRVEIVLNRSRTPAETDEICLQICDNGRGIDLENVPAKQRHGLVGIRERIEGLGGRLTLASRCGQGFRLTACLPVGHEPGR
jgi:signal transduction histidine kinase